MKLDRGDAAVGDYIRKLAQALRDVDQLEDKKAQAGFLAPCLGCPMQLICASGKPPSVVWCPECKKFFAPLIGKRIDCDILHIDHVVETGLCPCRSGIPSDVVMGVQLLDCPSD